jgi:hypothetical protein
MMNEGLKMKATPTMIRFVKMLPVTERFAAAQKAERVFTAALAQLTRFDDFCHERNVAMALEAAEAELAYMANRP